MCRFSKRNSAIHSASSISSRLNRLYESYGKSRFSEVLSSSYIRNSTSSNHSSQYANSTASRVALRDAILNKRNENLSKEKWRRLLVCLVLCFPPKHVDLALVSSTRSGRPLSRRRRLLKVPIDHRGRQNVVRTSVTHSAAPRVPLFCSCHILTSSVICY